MPSLRDKVWVVEDCDSETDLGNDDTNARTYCDPLEHINRGTCIALSLQSGPVCEIDEEFLPFPC